jgi:hypothetical protein
VQPGKEAPSHTCHGLDGVGGNSNGVSSNQERVQIRLASRMTIHHSVSKKLQVNLSTTMEDVFAAVEGWRGGLG